MLLEFDETVPVDPMTVYSYFRTPGDWTRLYGAFGDVEDRGDGWYAVPLYRFPFPLVARITRDEPQEHVAWEMKGFFRGTGEVRLQSEGSGTRIEGYEGLSIPSVPGLSPMLERRVLEPRFQKVWASGWRRLRATPTPKR